MIRVMISNGLRGKENPEQYVALCRKVTKDYYEKKGTPVELIDTYFSDFTGNRLQFLGKAIQNGLALADEVVFIDDWQNYDGCRCEHFIAAQYKVPCRYLETGTV